MKLLKKFFFYKKNAEFHKVSKNVHGLGVDSKNICDIYFMTLKLSA